MNLENLEAKLRKVKLDQIVLLDVTEIYGLRKRGMKYVGFVESITNETIILAPYNFDSKCSGSETEFDLSDVKNIRIMHYR